MRFQKKLYYSNIQFPVPAIVNVLSNRVRHFSKKPNQVLATPEIYVLFVIAGSDKAFPLDIAAGRKLLYCH